MSSQPSVAAAKRVLFDLGMQLPGFRTIALAQHLLSDSEGDAQARIARAVADVEDGVVALVAVEPDLREAQLQEAAFTVLDAAEAVVLKLCQQILAAS